MREYLALSVSLIFGILRSSAVNQIVIMIIYTMYSLYAHAYFSNQYDRVIIIQ